MKAVKILLSLTVVLVLAQLFYVFSWGAGDVFILDSLMGVSNGKQSGSSVAYPEPKVEWVDSGADSALSGFYPRLGAYVAEPDGYVAGLVKNTLPEGGGGFFLYHPQFSKQAYIVSSGLRILKSFDLSSVNGSRAAKAVGPGEIVGFGDMDGSLFSANDKGIAWRLSGKYHHDFDFVDGKVYALRQRKFKGYFFGDTVDVVKSGKLLYSLNIHKFAEAYIVGNKFLKPTYKTIRKKKERAGYPLRIISLDIARKEAKLFDKGDILITLGDMEMLFVLDRDGKDVKWTLGSEALQNPLDAVFLESGNILVLDMGFNSSKVKIVDPETRQAVIVIPVSDVHEGASVELLENGNILVVDPLTSVAEQVTSSGEVVWELHGPPGPSDGVVGTFFRMQALSKDEVDEFVSG